MKFQILSHAGLRINSGNKELLCDPWLLGSTYWRSWWNYPPIKSDLIKSLKPTAIYLTHIHWDHFQGPSLKLFDTDTLIVVPKGNYKRIKRDLNQMGYDNILELYHGESFNLDDDFEITSYQFGPFLDSALIIKTEGVTLFNANDAKFMGLPLKQICKKHPDIDFVFRSHSSANSRLCYEYMDNSDTPVDDMEQYIENFADFCKATNAKHAIPFASNHCFLHKDVYAMNDTIQTPDMVSKFWKSHSIKNPELTIMVSGDSWDSCNGFSLSSHDFFENRSYHLREYLEANQNKLEATYNKENCSQIKLETVQKYFQKLCAQSPWIIRKILVGNTNYLYVLSSGNTKYCFAINLLSKKSWTVDERDIGKYDVQIHTSTEIFKQCIQLDLFSHLSISKRVKYKVTKKTKSKMNGLNLLFNCYEYDIVPIRKNFTIRSMQNWSLRWRELLLYVTFVKDKIFKGKLDQKRYIQNASIAKSST